jgi:hypothetical protein
MGVADIGGRSFDKLATATLPKRLILKRIEVHSINETLLPATSLSETFGPPFITVLNMHSGREVGRF